VNTSKKLELIKNEFFKDNLVEAKKLCLSVSDYSNNDKVLNLLGLIEFKNNNYLTAIKYFHQSLNNNPKNINTLNNIGHVLIKRKKYNSSISFLKKAIDINKRFFSAYLNLSIVYKNLNEEKKSIESLKKFLNIEKNSFEGNADLGKLYFDFNKYEESLKYYNIALKINNKSEIVHYNLALLFDKQNKFHNAIEYYKKSLELKPNFYDCQFNLSLLYLKLGRCDKGIKLYDSRFYKNKNRNNEIINKECLSLTKDKINKENNLYITSEQGYGDIFQFCRFLIFLQNQQYNVSLVINDDLFEFYYNQTLFKKIIKKSDFLNLDKTSLLSIPLMSIPKIFNLNKNNYRFHKYLHAKQYQIERWSKLINNKYFNIGIAWYVKNKYDNYDRSIPIKFFSNLQKINKVKLFSLHLKSHIGNLKNNQQEYNDIVFFDDIDKNYRFEDTAAIISNLDLVISVDTSLAHLSAAIGKKTWILLSWNHDWRWGIKNNNSFWYKSVKLFRANKKNEWKKVFEKILQDINTNV